jgi:hypothetical protein
MSDVLMMTPLDEDGKWCNNTLKPCVQWLTSRGKFDGKGKTKEEALQNLEKVISHGKAADDHD